MNHEKYNLFLTTTPKKSRHQSPPKVAQKSHFSTQVFCPLHQLKVRNSSPAKRKRNYPESQRASRQHQNKKSEQLSYSICKKKASSLMS